MHSDMRFSGHLVALRLATTRIADTFFTWGLRNGERGRAVSRNKDPIPWERHLAWFKAFTEVHGQALYIVDIPAMQGLRIGTGRIHHVDQDDCEISYMLSEAATGQGVGTWLVAQLCKKASHFHYANVIAEVQPDNLTSCHVLEKNGFHLESTNTSDLIRYQKSLA